MLPDPNTLAVTPDRQRMTVPLPELGEGVEVIVRQMTLDQYLHRLGRDVGPDGFVRFSTVLADCVLGEGDAPLFTAEQWEIWGVQHIRATMRLYHLVRKLSGLDTDTEEAEKN